MNRIDYCVDIGSEKNKNFAWVRRKTGIDFPGKTLNGLLKDLWESLQSDSIVTIGFECPLFFYMNSDSDNVTSQRPGEGNRPWSAGAGAQVTVTGVAQITWLFSQLRQKIDRGSSTDFPSFHLLNDWDKLKNATSGLFIWEAFISGKDKPLEKNKEVIKNDHIEDCKIALDKFEEKLNSPIELRYADKEVFSIIGAVLLRTGWTADVNVLNQACFVVGRDIN